ncbi:MAG: NAD(+)/NADH kinase [Deltaproteobacteria bacterium]|nr:NAD(+)/NADH kinase [Deltaproteobacteria bacterium]
MPMPFKQIVIVVKNDDRARAEAEDLRNWLEQLGLAVLVDRPRVSGCGYEREEKPAQPPVALIVVLGGDGTLLYAARTFAFTGAPLLGVNMGGLGFLTELNRESLRPALEQVLAGNYQIENRMMLDVEIRGPNDTLTTTTVLNDAVINKGVLARIIELSVKVDHWNLTSYRADGLIIATPTGSTAYNLAAGGPIVHPAHESILLTPICPFTLSNRPLILPKNSVIEIRLGADADDVYLTSDGQVSCPLTPKNLITVRKSESGVRLIKNLQQNYFHILRTKLGWG